MKDYYESWKTSAEIQYNRINYEPILLCKCWV